ncbi:YppE family protein [Bacillus kexueae]|uniref:YppE family protein n=1 Tax=Aeribacillus kexueae TaxID=2078952 RepID=UPI001FAEEA66
MHEHSIIPLTIWLLDKVEESKLRFEHTKREEKSFSFYEEVKPYCDEVHQTLQEWEVLAYQFIKQYHPKYVTKTQIEMCKEHIEQISVQSFYYQTSLKRFKDATQSAIFILETLIERAKEKEPTGK